jgi:hypothetical protein
VTFRLKGKYNQEFKDKVKKAGLSICEVGYHAGITEPTLFRWLRHPLNEEHEKLLQSTLDKLIQER